MIQPVILCGGSGTRLWPLSREHHPKPLHALNGERTLVQEGRIATFGVPPTAPETGYGYIRTGKGGYVEAFVEKPDVATAREYLASGRYLWNSGIFAVRASVWLDAVSSFRKDIFAACERSYRQGKRDGSFWRVDEAAFAECPSDSIDYAVMERITAEPSTIQAVVVRLDAGWSDVGAWDALWAIEDKDDAGNAIKGDVHLADTRNALVLAQHRMVACVGMDDGVVIETPDAVMVAHKDKAQAVGKLVAQLKAAGREETLTHRKVHRPWGSYDGIEKGERFQVKRIVVEPGAALSLQMHYHRAEHWIVVRGTARVTPGEETFLLTENESTYIPPGTKHRLANPGKLPLEIIEVQSGAYLGEDDIVRFEDAYGR